MDRALVVGASGGIGTAVVEALAARGTSVTALSRRQDGLDVTDPESVARVIGSLDGPFDLVFVATGALEIDGHVPEKAFSQITADGLMDQIRVNTLGPALVIQKALPLLAKDRRAVLAVLSARVGSIGDNKIGGWHSYRTAKAALNQLVHGAAIEMRRTHKQAIAACLHPGTVATPFTAKYAGRHKTVPPSEAAANLLRVIDGLETDQSGGFYDWSGAEVPW